MHMPGTISEDGAAGIAAQPRYDRRALSAWRNEIHGLTVAMLRGLAAAGNHGAGTAGRDDFDGTEFSLKLCKNRACLRGEAGA